MKRVGSIFLIVVLLFLISCKPVVDETKVCTTDSDCVASACCHATDVVNKQHAPDCAGTFCTMECQPQTLDCGQGQTACIKGECKAIIEE